MKVADIRNNLADAIYGPVVDGHVAGTVYYLAQLDHVDDATLSAIRAAVFSACISKAIEVAAVDCDKRASSVSERSSNASATV